MSTTIKTYLGIFILFLSVFTMVSILSASIDVVNARDFHAAVVAEIEDAHFAPSVIEACTRQAQEAGYELLLDRESIVYDEEGNPSLMVVIIQYEFRMDFLQVINRQQIRGFAR